jgi:hypothetical protein
MADISRNFGVVLTFTLILLRILYERNEWLEFPLNRIYGKQLVDGPVRNWPSDRMRSNLRNLFLDKLSCLLAKHRSLDYLFWGIPDEKRGGDRLQSSLSVNK